MAIQTLDQWRALIGDRALVDYALLQEATGISVRTLRYYNSTGYMPKSDGRGAWAAGREDLALWVIGESRPGRGARTDLKTSNTTTDNHHSE